MSASNPNPPEPNPYSPPASSFVEDIQMPAAETGASSPSETVIELLAQTRPWVILFSVLGFIFSGIIICVSVVQAAMATGRGDSGEMGGAVGMLIGGVIYFYPALLLSRYAGRIRDLKYSHRLADLEAALAAQKSFWRFCGIVAAVVMVVYALVLLGALLIGLVAV